MPLPAQVDPIKRQLVRERVYSTLRGWIVHGTLRPNEQMRDVELAGRLGVSRTPVREALRRLEDEGLVRAAPHRWTRVSPLDVGDARRLYPIIWSLESLAVRSAGLRLSGSDLREMAAANARIGLALRANDAVEASAADREFHAVFVRRTENPELVRILNDWKVKLRRLEVAYFGGRVVAQRSVVEHKRILSALRRKDVAAAGQAVEVNWRNSLERLAVSRKGPADGPLVRLATTPTAPTRGAAKG